ncbi:MAG: ParB N-terminal domain-containing protein [Planctomycetaceae bacterium]|nr:ParB N-terminal domain-containing protein [Planctomycetaceae bacterium]
MKLSEENLSIELRDVTSIRPYERNPRINDKAVDAVAASLKEFGFRQPIVVDSDNIIIVGHTRYKAALKLGLQKVPALVASDMTTEQAKAYRIADNKSGEIAEWDMEILPIEICELQESGFDLDLLAFGDKELTQLLNVNMSHGETDADDIPEPPEQAITKRGNLWILGAHRLMCGDSANSDDVDRLLDGCSMQMCHTDPPYGVCVESRSANAIASGASSFPGEGKPLKRMRAKDRPIINDQVGAEEFDRLLDGWFGNIARVLEPGRAAYIWGGYANLANYPAMFKKHGLYWSQCVIWNKLHPVMNRKDFMSCFELCYYCWKEGAAHQFFGQNNERDLWKVKKVPSRQTVHLTQKPVELAIRAIQLSSRPNENVLELFGGNGSTLIACEQTGRRCFAMEIDELYCDVIVKRWEEFTGKEAKRIINKEESHD